MTDTLPAGVHPNDRAEPLGPSFGHTYTGPADRATNAQKTGRRPFGTSNEKALPVFERSASDWTVRIVTVSGAANSDATARACGRVKGRKRVLLSVPTTLPDGTTPNGVLFGPDEGSVQQGIAGCGILNPGDAYPVYTEAPIWIGLIGSNTSGAVQVLEEYNPPDIPGT